MRTSTPWTWWWTRRKPAIAIGRSEKRETASEITGWTINLMTETEAQKKDEEEPPR